MATCRMHCVGRCCWHSLRQLFFIYLTHSSCLKTLNQTKCSFVKDEEKQPFFSLKPAAVSTHQPAQLSGAKLGPTSMLQSFYHFHCNQHPNRYANAACLAGGVLFCSGLGFLFFFVFFEEEGEVPSAAPEKRQKNWLSQLFPMNLIRHRWTPVTF